ncbi:MAG: sigma-E factor negative regulatory protein [Gammaproteobacteria bacterium]
MSEQIREQISALVDGELADGERRLLLERLMRDPALRAHWANYQLISDSLRQSLAPLTDPGLAERVMAVVDAEPDRPAERASPWSGLAKSVAGLAVAASVAVVAVLTLQTPEMAPPGAGVQVAATPPAPADYVRLTPSPAVPVAQAQEDRLNEYLVNHSEYAASGGMPGMLPHVRIVGYERD